MSLGYKFIYELFDNFGKILATGNFLETFVDPPDSGADAAGETLKQLASTSTTVKI